MNKICLLVGWVCFLCTSLQGQTTKPAVMVVGNGSAAVAAAIQAARSGVKTTLLLQANGFAIQAIGDDLNSGIQAEFLSKIKAESGVADSLPVTEFDKHLANDVLTKWTDTLKNLTVIKPQVWIKANRSGKTWRFKLSDGQTVKPQILILAADPKLKDVLSLPTIHPVRESALTYDNTLYRTSVAAGKRLNQSTATVFSLYNFLISNQENLICLNENEGMLIGQAAGATAAYADYFGVTTSQSNLKTIQGELLAYNLALMPLADISLNDPNWKAIQMVSLSGVLKAQMHNHSAFFSPASPVNTDEIKAAIKGLFYKAQIWFDDYQSEIMTLQSTLSLVSYVGNKSAETTLKEIQKKWKTYYGFEQEFDLNAPASRREFATILQDYMPPFNVSLDKNGKVIR